MENTAIIDVDTFFEHIIDEYTKFGKLAILLATELQYLQPSAIRRRCRHLQNERQHLTTLDKQLLEILDFAGEELLQSNHLPRYRTAFSTATLAIDEIHSQLLSLRSSLQEVTQH